MANSNPLSSMFLSRALLDASPGGQPRARRSRRIRRAEPKVFLAEHYVPAVDSTRLEGLARHLAAAADGDQGGEVSLLGILGLPSDESLMSLFAAPGPEAVAGTLDRAGVPADRIVPVLWRAGFPSTIR